MKCATLSTYFWTENENTSAFFHARVLPYPPTSPVPFHTLICYAIVSTGVILPPLLPSAPHHKGLWSRQDISHSNPTHAGRCNMPHILYEGFELHIIPGRLIRQQKL